MGARLPFRKRRWWGYGRRQYLESLEHGWCSGGRGCGRRRCGDGSSVTRGTSAAQGGGIRVRGTVCARENREWTVGRRMRVTALSSRTSRTHGVEDAETWCSPPPRVRARRPGFPMVWRRCWACRVASTPVAAARAAPLTATIPLLQFSRGRQCDTKHISFSCSTRRQPSLGAALPLGRYLAARRSPPLCTVRRTPYAAAIKRMSGALRPPPMMTPCETAGMLPPRSGLMRRRWHAVRRPTGHSLVPSCLPCTSKSGHASVRVSRTACCTVVPPTLLRQVVPLAHNGRVQPSTLRCSCTTAVVVCVSDSTRRAAVVADSRRSQQAPHACRRIRVRRARMLSAAPLRAETGSRAWGNAPRSCAHQRSVARSRSGGERRTANGELGGDGVCPPRASPIWASSSDSARHASGRVE